MPYAVVIHGGAGLIRRASLSPEREAACRAALSQILAEARDALEQGASALDVVVEAVVALEETPQFNAGRGAVLNAQGFAELDAAVMDGSDRRAGAVAAARTVRSPVRLARRIMEQTSHVMVVGPPADDLAVELGLPTVDPAWFVTPERQAQQARAAKRGGLHLDHGSEERDVYGTVGAVACSSAGDVAAATSTGGMVNQRVGRVGDTPIIGAGTYAWNQTCAVSATGHGEPFIRAGVAGRVSARMELLGESLELAARNVLTDVDGLGGQGGLIAVDRHGRVAMPFNTAGMFRGAWLEGGAPHIGIW